MIPFAGTRPSIPEYPQIADNIRQAIYEVQFENKDPNQALEEAPLKICKGVGLVVAANPKSKNRILVIDDESPCCLSSAVMLCL